MNPTRSRRLVRILRTAVVTVLMQTVLMAAGALLTRPLLAQANANVVGRPIAQPADTLFREGTRNLTKGNYRRAAELFVLLRQRFPRSPYAVDSYYWQAFALQRLDENVAWRQALVALDEQQLRYPEAALTTDVQALRERVEGLVARDDGSSRPADRCSDDDDVAAITALTALSQISDGDAVLGYLASMLAMRTPCATESRRSAVYLLARRREPGARAMLEVVVQRDPDARVREDAAKALETIASAARQAPAMAASAVTGLPVARVMPPARAIADSGYHTLGDSSASSAVVSVRLRDSKLSVQLAEPSQLIVVAVTAGQPPELLAPATARGFRQLTTGSGQVDLRPFEAMVAVDDRDLLRSRAETQDVQRQAAIDACVSRTMAAAQAALLKAARIRTEQAKAGRSSETLEPDRTATMPELQTITQECTPMASRQPGASALPSAQRVVSTRDQQRYLLVLATPNPLSVSHLLVRLGTVQPTGATAREMLEGLANLLFAGTPGTWSGGYIGW